MRQGVQIGLLATALYAVAGCAPVGDGSGQPEPGPTTQPASRPATRPATRPAGGWIDLYNGRDRVGWWCVQGSPGWGDGAMVLDGRSGDVTVLSTKLKLADGEVEVRIRRPTRPAEESPFTVALRLPLRLGWRSVCFVCRPKDVAAFVSTSRRSRPTPTQVARFAPAGGVETWRFQLAGTKVRCYRFGRKLLEFADPKPVAGTMALTASRCRVEVLSVRYRPAAGDPATRPARPGPRSRAGR